MSVTQRQRLKWLSTGSGDVDFLEPPDRRDMLAALDASTELSPGTHIGCYEIVELIANGGMGAVYRARRADDAYDKEVAIKIIRAGLASPPMRQRFHRERQALAQLDHPNISHLHDGGETCDGLPFLVMEYIPGRPIDQYCDENRLSVRERLVLFLTVAAAVQYAHQNLVVHRDLKPGNILVSDDGQVKLVDFGVSRLLEAEGADATREVALTSCRALTPQYASPEQIRGESVTTSADVYSLGVVLYELLCGHRPYRLENVPPYEADRIICEAPPPAPSTVLGRTEDTNTAGREVLTPPVVVSAARSDHPAGLRRTLSGDLDNIVLKALRKDPARRYASVERFAEDIRRSLAGLPVTARKDTLRYRATKFIKRNRPQVIAASVAILALIAALVGISFGLVHARQAQHAAQGERNVAIAARTEAQEVLCFYQDMLATANPYRSGRTVSVLELLDDAERRIARDLANKPEVEAGVRLAIAHSYASLMMWPRVAPNAERALRLYRAVRAHDDPVLGECLTLLGRAYSNRGRGGAVEAQQEALAIRRQAFGEEHPLVAETIGSLGYALWVRVDGPPKWAAAESRYLEAIDMLNRLGRGDGRVAARLTMSLGFMYGHSNREADAEARYLEAMEKYNQLPVTEDLYELATINLYSQLLEGSDRIAEAATMVEQYRDMIPDGFDRQKTCYATWRMARLTMMLGNHPAALGEYLEALALECEILAKQWEPGSEHLLGLAAELRTEGARLDPGPPIRRTAALLDPCRIEPHAAELSELLIESGDVESARALTAMHAMAVR